MLPDRTQQEILCFVVEFFTITRHDCISTKRTFNWNALVTDYMHVTTAKVIVLLLSKRHQRYKFKLHIRTFVWSKMLLFLIGVSGYAVVMA